MYILFLLSVLRAEFLKRFFYLKALLFSILYFSLTIFAINYKSFLSFSLSEYDIFAKLKILTYIFYGSFLALYPRDQILLVVTSLLFGINVQLVARKIKFLASRGGLHFTLGAGLVTLVATGCATCGLSLASIAGLSATIALLPFGGVELYFLSIAILLASLFYNLHTLVKVCKIER